MEIQQGKEKTLSTEVKRVWGLRIAAGVGAVGALALAAPVITAAATSAAGLVVVGVAAVVLIGGFQALPLLGQKWENKLLAMRKAEARANPIEQLQNYLLQKADNVNQFRNAVAKIGAQIKNMADMLSDRKQQKPNGDFTKQERALKSMIEAHAILVKKYERAEKALVELNELIEDKQFEWKFGQAGQAAIQSLNATSGEELLNQMLANEAFDSVRTNFNQVFAELELEAAKLNSAKELSFEEGMVIDVSSIQLPVAEKVRK